MIEFINDKAKEMGCRVALYNHSGWFGNPYNEIQIVNSLPDANLKMVYNFHHGRDHMDTFLELIQDINPYLSAVNLNGMKKNGDKIMPLGSGNHEKEMITILKISGFNGPWGILGHVENVDVRIILEQNIRGLKALENY